MVQVPGYLLEDVKEVGKSISRYSEFVSELYDRIVREGTDTLNAYLDGDIGRPEAFRGSKLMGMKLDWLDDNLANVEQLLIQLEMEIK